MHCSCKLKHAHMDSIEDSCCKTLRQTVLNIFISTNLGLSSILFYIVVSRSPLPNPNIELTDLIRVLEFHYDAAKNIMAATYSFYYCY